MRFSISSLGLDRSPKWEEGDRAGRKHPQAKPNPCPWALGEEEEAGGWETAKLMETHEEGTPGVKAQPTPRLGRYL